MKLRELFENSLIELLPGELTIDDFVGMSVMTDGLKASRDNIIGICIVGSDLEEVHTVLLNEGSPDKTEPYHGIPAARFMADGLSPVEGYRHIMESIGDRYIVMHNHTFGMKFIDEFTAHHGIPPINKPVMGSGLLHQALMTDGTVLPALVEDIKINDFVSALGQFSYPRNTKKSLDALFEMYNIEDFNKDYVTRIPEGIANAYKIVLTYRAMLDKLVFD